MFLRSMDGASGPARGCNSSKYRPREPPRLEVVGPSGGSGERTAVWSGHAGSQVVDQTVSLSGSALVRVVLRAPSSTPRVPARSDRPRPRSRANRGGRQGVRRRREIGRATRTATAACGSRLERRGNVGTQRSAPRRCAWAPDVSGNQSVASYRQTRRR